MTEFDKFLREAEVFMQKAERWTKQTYVSDDQKAAQYREAIYLGIQALYKQNQAIVELLKKHYQDRPSAREGEGRPPAKDVYMNDLDYLL